MRTRFDVGHGPEVRADEQALALGDVARGPATPRSERTWPARRSRWLPIRCPRATARADERARPAARAGVEVPAPASRFRARAPASVRRCDLRRDPPGAGRGDRPSHASLSLGRRGEPRPLRTRERAARTIRTGARSGPVLGSCIRTSRLTERAASQGAQHAAGPAAPDHARRGDSRHACPSALESEPGRLGVPEEPGA